MKNPGRPELTSQWAHLQSGQTVTVLLSFPQENDVNEHKVLMTALHPPCLRPSVCPTRTTSLQGHLSLAHARARQVWWPCGKGHACGCAHGRKGPQIRPRRNMGSHQPHVGPGQHLSGSRGGEKRAPPGPPPECLNLTSGHTLSSSSCSGRPEAIGSP